MKVSRAASVNSIDSMSQTDSLWLVSQCIAGNEEAIESLFRQYEAGVFRLALSIVDDPAEASEITQETFVAALRALGKYQEKQTFKAWLYTIALNRSRSHLRKRKVIEKLHGTLNRLFQMDFEKQALPEDMAIQNEKEETVWRSLNQLDEKHRIVVILRYFHELPIHEISEILSVNEGTIHSRLHSAREKLRMALEQTEKE